MCAVFEAQRSGAGQVVDASMVEGSAALMHMMHSMKAQGFWKDERGVNLLDGAAHFYDTYETADGKYISVGAIEPQFYRLLVELTGVDAKEFSPQLDPASWPALKQRLAGVIRGKTRDEWCSIMEGTDACVAPVLSMTEAPLTSAQPCAWLVHRDRWSIAGRAGAPVQPYGRAIAAASAGRGQRHGRGAASGRLQ